jgi:hypothetical protein
VFHVFLAFELDLALAAETVYRAVKSISSSGSSGISTLPLWNLAVGA